MCSICIDFEWHIANWRMYTIYSLFMRHTKLVFSATYYRPTQSHRCWRDRMYAARLKSSNRRFFVTTYMQVRPYLVSCHHREKYAVTRRHFLSTGQCTYNADELREAQGGERGAWGVACPWGVGRRGPRRLS